MKKPRPRTTLLACAERNVMMDLADIILLKLIVCTSRVLYVGIISERAN